MVGGQILAQTHPRRGGLRQHRRCLAVEAQRIAQHPPVIAPRQHGRLGDEPREAARIFERAAIERDRKTHIALRRLHAEVAEEGAQIGIVRFVIDDEPGIDRRSADVDRMAMAADPVFALIERHAVVARQEPRSRHAGDAGADDGEIAARGLGGRPGLGHQHAVGLHLGSQGLTAPCPWRINVIRPGAAGVNPAMMAYAQAAPDPSAPPGSRRGRACAVSSSRGGG